MGIAPTGTAESSAGDIGYHAQGFELTLASRRKRPNTIKSYLEAVEQLDAFLTANGMPHDVASIRREHVETFIVDQTVGSSDVTPYTLSHLAFRVPEWDQYLHVRTLLERHAVANRENFWT